MYKQKSQSLISGALVLTLAGVIVKIVGYISTLPLTNYWLGPKGMGYYNVAYSLYLPVYTMAVSGFPVAIAKIISSLNEQKKFKDVKVAKRAANILFAVIGVLGSVVMLALSKPYADSIKNPLAVYTMLAIAPSIFFSAMLSARRGFDQGAKNMTTTAISQVIEVMVKAVFGLLACYFTMTALNNEYSTSGMILGKAVADANEASKLILALSAAAAMMAVTVSVIVAYVYFLVRGKRTSEIYTAEQYELSPDPDSQKKYIKLILVLGIPIALSSLVANIAGLIDTTMLQSLISRLISNDADKAALYASYHGLISDIKPDEIANYLYGCFTVYANKIYMLIAPIVTTFSISALPIISAMWAVKDTKGINRNASSALKMTSFIASPIGFGMAAIPQQIILLVYSNAGAAAEIAAPSLAVLGLTAVMANACTPIFYISNAIGRVDVPIKLTIASSVAKIIATYFLVSIPEVNILAASYSNIIYFLVMFVFGMMFLRREVGFKPSYFDVFIKPIIAGLLCGAFARLTCTLLPSGRMYTLISIMVGGVVYFIAAGVLRILDPDEVLALPAGNKIYKFLRKLGAVKAVEND